MKQLVQERPLVLFNLIVLKILGFHSRLAHTKYLFSFLTLTTFVTLFIYTQIKLLITIDEKKVDIQQSS